MYMASTSQSEVRLTLEVAMEMANQLTDGEPDLQELLREAGFSRASEASVAALTRLATRMRKLIVLFEGLPEGGLEVAEAADMVSDTLKELPISPAIVDHDGIGPHIHWTPVTAQFDDQVISDVLMALGQELCDNGTDRFGSCGAADCSHLFYDNTRNNSRRFCGNPRCASRTHTADHRARRRAMS